MSNWEAIFCAILSSLSTERNAASVLSSPLFCCISMALSSRLRSSSRIRHQFEQVNDAAAWMGGPACPALGARCWTRKSAHIHFAVGRVVKDPEADFVAEAFAVKKVARRDAGQDLVKALIKRQFH
jgi:hypothetical protein